MRRKLRRIGARGRSLRGAGLAVLALLVPAGPASAASLLEDARQATEGTTAARCFSGDLSGTPGVDARYLAIPGPGLVRAHLEGPASADWDLAVLERETGRVIAASAARGSSEFAEGFVLEPTDAVVQACRRAGDGAAQLDLETVAIDASTAPAAPQLLRVETPDAAAKQRLQSLGLDLTEHGGDDFLSVVSYGAADVATLDANGFDYEVEVQDLVQSAVEDRQADLDVTRAERRAALREIPSGRTTYRRLFDYQQELKDLAEDNPDLVRPLTLANETWEGRPVEGIEITTNPGNVDDGKPVFLQMGVHHAREWPSGEHAMEYALELIEGYRAGDPRIENLVERSRTIVVPVVNPDGFNVSREAGEIGGVGGGRHANSEAEMTAQIVGIAYEFWRKNCRLPDDSEAGQCLGSPASSGAAHTGVDLNRNYGGFWGGPGAAAIPTDPTYRGMGPFSEPETRNVQELVSNRQVTTLITNHTFSNLWLRPPGQAVSPDTPDEDLYRTLGEQAVAENGYSNIRAWELYDTTGAVEDWSYWSTGGLGYTPEIGCTQKTGVECIYGDFHGPYADHVVTEYGGGSPSAPTGGGNREAYLITHEAALDAANHSLIEGDAPAGALLRVQKTFQTQTWEGEHGSFEDHLESAMVVPGSGEFEFHVNPSTRPVSLLQTGREPDGDPSPAVPFSGAADAEAQPCEDFETEDPTCFNDHPFVIPANDPGVIDNAKLTVRAEWGTPASDWDLRLYRDSNSDGSSVGETEIVSSAQGTTTFEEVSLGEPNNFPAPGDYVVRMVNYLAVEPYEGTITFAGPDPPTGPGEPEAWTLTCEVGGEVLTSRQVFVDRGESEQLDLNPECSRQAEPPPGQPAPAGSAKCANQLLGTGKRDRLTGTAGADLLAGRLGSDRLRGGDGDDCLFGGGGRDRLHGGAGSDRLSGGTGSDIIVSRDGERDTVRCGKGRDLVKADATDTLKDCERRRIR